MSVIYKYPINLVPSQIIDMPEGARILSVQTQFADRPCIWAFVDICNKLVGRVFYVIATGQSFDSKNMLYIGTFQLDGGALVFHLYEKVENE